MSLAASSIDFLLRLLQNNISMNNPGYIIFASYLQNCAGYIQIFTPQACARGKAIGLLVYRHTIMV